MMSKFMRFKSRGRHPSKFSSHSTSICFPVWPGLGAETDCLMAGTAEGLCVALRDAMEWKLQAPSISSSAKMAKGSFVVCRQSANLGSQVETVSLEGRRGAASAMTPPRNFSQRQRHDCDQLEGPGRRQQRRKNPPGLLVLAPFPDPETTLHGRNACACFHSTTRLAQMGLRGQEITCCIRCEGTSSIAHCHCPPNGRTRPPVRRRWRGGRGKVALRLQHSYPAPHSHAGCHGILTVAPRHLILRLRSSQPTPTLVAWHPAGFRGSEWRDENR